MADRLWLVKDGHVAPYDGDLESYRKMLLQGDSPTKTTPKQAAKPAPEKPRRQSRDAILALRADLRKCEERVEKLNGMRDRIAAKLADPAIYEDVPGAGEWQKKYAEVTDGLARAESLWMTALERLEKAGG